MSPLQNTTRVCLRLLTSVAVAGFSFLSDARANLVVNGGFEAGPVQTGIGGGVLAGGGATDWYEGDLSLWDVGGSQVTNAYASNSQAYFGLVGGGPKSGTLAAVLSNFPTYDGYISQDIVGTVVGSIYKVSFWLANQIGDASNNYVEARWGGDYTNSSSPISGGTWLVGGTPTIPGAIPVAAGWTYYEFLVTATAPTSGDLGTRLSFIGGNDAAGILIDDVSVEFVAVPEISSFGVVAGLGLLAFGSMVRFRRRALAAV